MLFSLACQVVAFAFLCLLWLAIPEQLAFIIVQLAFIVCFLYASFLLGNFLDLLPRFRVSSKNKAVFITGCDSGFGFLLAHRLDSLGYKVFAGCLSASSKGASDLRSSTSRVIVVEVDVTKDESVKKAYDTVVKNLDGDTLWCVFNNAGVITHGELEWTPLEEYKRQFEINTFGVVRVTQAFLPLLRQNKGRLVTTTSFGGRLTFPGFASYCMSKHASSSFCDGLRMEMHKFGVAVISIEPFSFKTPLTELDTILGSADRTWSKAPDSLKADYGSDYIDAFKRSEEKFHGLATCPNVHAVIDAMVEAVTVTSPHYSYTVGDLKSRSSLWFICKLPRWMREYIIRKYVSFDTDIQEFLQRRNCAEIKSKKDL